MLNMRDGAISLQLKRAGVVLFAMLLASAAQATEGARDWITRMNRALLTRNYEGVLLHQNGASRDVKRIIHRVQDGRMSERVTVVSPDGAGLEFTRNGSEWTAYYPKQHKALVQTRNRSYGFLTAFNGLNDESARYYVISDGGPVMIEGRAAQRISLEPRDALRYGYRFWLDAKTTLPLKTQVVTRAGEVLEEVSFISISFPEKIADERLKPEMDTTGFSWYRNDIPMYTPGLKKALSPRDELLPAGFHTRIFTRSEVEAKAPGPRTRFIVTDGVASVSVFVERADKYGKGATGKPGATPESRTMVMGSSATYVARMDDLNVTVVGEVPPATVKAIAGAMRPE